MAATIIADAGAEDANAYVTLQEANTYHETHPYASAWEEAEGGEDAQNRAIIHATRMLDTWFDWYGSISTTSQRLLWPRRGVLRPGAAEQQVAGATNEWDEPFGTLLPSDEIPRLIKEATSELARQLLVSDRSSDSALETQGLTGLKVGPIDLTFRTTTAKPIPDAVMSMVNGLGVPRSRYGGAVTLRRA